MNEPEQTQLEMMTLAQQIEEDAYLNDGKARQDAQDEIRRRAAAPLRGDAGDLTGIIPGMENHVSDDVPLFGFSN